MKVHNFSLYAIIGILALIILGLLWNPLSDRNLKEVLINEKTPSPTPVSIPQVISPAPGTFLGDVLLLSSFQIEFSEPVTGLRAWDFTVNGIPATSVQGSGQGPYTFLLPPFQQRELSLVLAPGDIESATRGSFGGASWTLRYFKKDADDDLDGLSNGEEINIHTDPLKVDTDSDGMADHYEVRHGCLNPFVDDGKTDQDKDGFSNLEEFIKGTEPCPPSQ